MDNNLSQDSQKITNLEIKEDNYQQNNIEEEIMPQSSPWHFILSSYIPIWKYDEQSVLRINLTREKLYIIITFFQITPNINIYFSILLLFLL